MPSKMTLSIFDDINNKKAEGLTYDLWRINENNNRIKIKHDTITDDNQHILIEANTNDDLGSYEIILYVKNYYEHNNPDLNIQDNRTIIPFGINQLERDYHLNIHITPSSFTCTL